MAVLSAKEPDEVEFLSLVEMRDDTIQAWLNDVSQTDKIPFIEAEMIANGALVAYTELLFKASLKQLTGLVRGRKAVKKYI